jgi:hypothetical protein
LFTSTYLERYKVKRKLLAAFALLSILLASSALLTPSKAADYTKIGVKIGDNSTYSFTLVNSTINVRADFSSYVKNVTGTLVTLNFTYYNPGGSVNTTLLFGPFNVSTGEGGIGFFLICANLSAHDPVNVLPSVPSINETVSMVAAGVTRTVNHLNMSIGATRFNVWWDKPTGLMVKLTAIGPASLPGLGNFTLTSTSLWSLGGLPITTTTLLIIGVGAIIVVVGVAVVLHGRGKGKK